MPRKIVANLHGEQLCFNCVRFVDEDSNYCGCEISVSCSSVGRKLWNALRNVVFLLLLHVTLKYTTVSYYDTSVVPRPSVHTVLFHRNTPCCCISSHSS